MMRHAGLRLTQAGGGVAKPTQASGPLIAALPADGAHELVGCCCVQLFLQLC